jgi:hypothetical protein
LLRTCQIIVSHIERQGLILQKHARRLKIAKFGLS